VIIRSHPVQYCLDIHASRTKEQVLTLRTAMKIERYHKGDEKASEVRIIRLRRSLRLRRVCRDLKVPVA
jgi:hypothetical protein